jgi:hypothetical protein
MKFRLHIVNKITEETGSLLPLKFHTEVRPLMYNVNANNTKSP